MRSTITVFGAESTGKTTLSIGLAHALDGLWMPEYARPYLESYGPGVTDYAMHNIWDGQARQQMMTEDVEGIVIQDTDLYSTVGYWDFWNGKTPSGLVHDADRYSSDLYLITESNIPFVPDPLRFGGSVRESTDEYWVGLCEGYSLNYRLIKSTDKAERLFEALRYVREVS